MKLALLGGEPVRDPNKLFPKQLNMGKEEKEAVNRVLDGGRLSCYRGCYNEWFQGGPEVQTFEREFAEKYNVRYAIAVNSCTSALWVACHAVGLGPGCEYIATPWSMTCSATIGLMTGAVPIFADIDETFCLEPNSVKQRITDKTKAIIVVDLFGQIHSHQIIKKIADSYDISIIVDSAQAPNATYTWPNDDTIQYAGSFGDLTCFSFTTGKIISCGEGGIITTNNSDLARRCQLLRNHAESVLADMENDKVRNRFADDMDCNMVGQNLRMIEINAAIMREQIKKIDYYVKLRQSNASIFDVSIPEVAPCFSPSYIREGNNHVYYVHPMLYDRNKCDGIPGRRFIEAVKAELPPEEGRPDKSLFGFGYIKPLQTLPIFRRKKLYKETRFPFDVNNDTWIRIQENYTLDSCPNAKRYWEDEVAINMAHGLFLADSDRKDIINAFEKVWVNRQELK